MWLAGQRDVRKPPHSLRSNPYARIPWPDPMTRPETLFYLHVSPQVLADLADAQQHPFSRFWDLLYEHQTKMLSPAETDIIRCITWLCSEGDVLCENCISWHSASKIGGRAPGGCCVRLDATGATEALARIERAPVDRRFVLYCASHCDERFRASPGWDDLVCRTFQDFVTLLRQAATDDGRILAALVFDEPPLDEEGLFRG